MVTMEMSIRVTSLTPPVERAQNEPRAPIPNGPAQKDELWLFKEKVFRLGSQHEIRTDYLPELALVFALSHFLLHFTVKLGLVDCYPLVNHFFQVLASWSNVRPGKLVFAAL